VPGSLLDQAWIRLRKRPKPLICGLRPIDWDRDRQTVGAFRCSTTLSHGPEFRGSVGLKRASADFALLSLWLRNHAWNNRSGHIRQLILNDFALRSATVAEVCKPQQHGPSPFLSRDMIRGRCRHFPSRKNGEVRRREIAENFHPVGVFMHSTDFCRDRSASTAVGHLAGMPLSPPCNREQTVGVASQHSPRVRWGLRYCPLRLISGCGHHPIQKRAESGAFEGPHQNHDSAWRMYRLDPGMRGPPKSSRVDLETMLHRRRDAAPGISLA